jgi:hypothetical protein
MIPAAAEISDCTNASASAAVSTCPGGHPQAQIGHHGVQAGRHAGRRRRTDPGQPWHPRSAGGPPRRQQSGDREQFQPQAPPRQPPRADHRVHTHRQRTRPRREAGLGAQAVVGVGVDLSLAAQVSSEAGLEFTDASASAARDRPPGLPRMALACALARPPTHPPLTRTPVRILSR